MLYSRNCPHCNKKIQYKCKHTLDNAIKKNRQCNSCKNIGNKNCIGRKYSKETINKMKNTKLGKKVSNKTKLKMSIASMGNKNSMFGKLHSSETKERIANKLLGRKLPKEHCKHIGNSHRGKKRTMETKRKMRLSAIKRIERDSNSGFPIFPNHNPNACKLIEHYGKQNGYNFQHAENGGEFYIKELGYWADGYDKEKNVWIEVDEKSHKYKKQKDIQRQKEIEQFLKCKFIRIKI